MLALTIPERETIIRALDDPPPGLEELRAVLLREHVDRVRDGLVYVGVEWLLHSSRLPLLRSLWVAPGLSLIGRRAL